MTAAIRRTVTFPGISMERLKSMLGAYNGHLKQIEQRLDVQISHRGDAFFIDGEIDAVERAETLLQRLHEEAESSAQISADTLHMMIQGSQTDRELQSDDGQEHTGLDAVWLQTRKGRINPRGANQKRYVQRILQSDISFGIGPAGTGKTYLAVASAVDMLERNEIQRILLVRPAVEAGEKLGFLPGDLTQKIDPYLRPLYDALYDMIEPDSISRLLESGTIEVAPLAYMRGRTLDDAFIILDEAQNTSCEQMKMFLTRMGANSKVVVTGDITQIDLPNHTKSGLVDALEVLKDVDGIADMRFSDKDVVRHRLVQAIIKAYDRANQQKNI